jgi:hypothetical protein
MDSPKPTAPRGQVPEVDPADVPAPVRERYDLEPEPEPEPTVADVLEGVAAALEAAVDLAAPALTTARVRTILTRVQSASRGHVTADELLTALRRLVQDWRAS